MLSLHSFTEGQLFCGYGVVSLFMVVVSGQLVSGLGADTKEGHGLETMSK